MLSWLRVDSTLVSYALVYGVMLTLLVSDKMLHVDDICAVNFNWWVSFVYALFPWTLIASVPLLLLGRFARWFYMPVVTVFLVIEAIEWYVRHNFKMILDGDWIGMLMGSSREELLWFIQHALGFTSLAVIVVMCVVVWILVRMLSRVKNVRVNMQTVGVAFLFVCVFAYANSIITRHFNVFEELVAIHLISDSVRCFNSYAVLAEMKKHPQLPADVHASVNDMLGVVVLGESATRNHWGLYGYNRETTPNMSRRKNELVVFSTLTTPSGGTSEVMKYVFTTRTIEKKTDLRYTMAQVLRMSGFDVALLSNQERWGQVDGDESFVFAGCEPMVFMSEQGETNRCDEVLLSYLENQIQTTKSRQVIFLHLSGSHFPCNIKYPHDGAPFEPEKLKNYLSSMDTALMQNHYDNSIWYTDRVLEQIVKILERQGRPCWMAYLSDHGDTPSSKNWRTATDRDTWDVPFIIWLSQEYKAKYPDSVWRLEATKDKLLQSDQLLYGLLDFAGIAGLGVSPSENFLDDMFVPRKPPLIKGGKCVYPW